MSLRRQDASEEESQSGDSVDQIGQEIAGAFPDLDLAGFGVTGQLLVLAAHITRLREHALSQFDLTLADYDVLATLRRLDGPTGVNPGTLHRWITVTSGGLSKRLDRLEHRGLLVRKPDPHDRRGVRVLLTARGRRLFARALPAVLSAERDATRQGLGSEPAETQLTELLRRLLTAWERTERR